MTFEQWMKSVPEFIKGDPVWRVEAYRLALFAGDLAWRDVTKLIADKRTISVADQLNRAAGAISGDIAEGYSRRSGKDQARFDEYALGSSREAGDWYFKGRHILGDCVATHRMELLTHIIRSLLTIIANERGFSIREEPAVFKGDLLYPLDNPPTPDR